MKLVLAALLFSSAATASPIDVVLGIGASRTLPAPAGAFIRVGDGRVLKAIDLGSKVRVFGKRAGFARLAIGENEYAVRVTTMPAADAFDRLRAAIDGMRGLTLSSRADDVEIGGRLLRAQDWEALARAAGAESSYRFRAAIDAEAKDDALAAVRARLTERHLPEPALQLSPALASLSESQAPLKAAYESALKPLGFAVEINASLISLEPLVRVNILVAEMRRSHSARFGVAWPSSAKAQLLPEFVAPGGGGSPVAVDVNALEQTGAGRVLASPNLLCRSGKEAEFIAGGEFPIQMKSFASQAVEWKKYGVLLRVKPKADAQGRMSIALETEVSDLDRSLVVGGVPAISLNRIQSHFDLRKPRTIALSGLLKNEWGDAREGLPGLSRIPILGALFGSRDWLEKRSELVIFVTPETISPDAE